MRTYKTGYAVVAALAAFALMIPSVQAAQLNNITMSRSQDFTVVTLYGDAPASVSHQAIEAKGGKPDRIVVDLTGVEHALPKNNFDQLPAGSIARIRTSQFAVSPEPVVRVVLDLATSAAYKLETAGNNVRIMVSLPSDPPIASVWSATNTPVLAQTEANGATPAAPTVKTPVMPMPVIADAKPLPMAPPENEAVESTPLPEPAEVTNAVEPAVTEPEESASNLAAEKLEDVPPASPDAPEVPLPMPTHKGSQVIDYNIPKPGLATTTDEPVATTPGQAAPAPKKAETNNVATEDAAPEPVLAKTDGARVPDQVSPENLSDSKGTANPTNATADSESPMPAESPEVADADEGSAPIASLTTLPPLDGNAPAVVPARSKILYHTNGRRDPFMPLLQVGAAYNSAALPDVGSLRMVGVLHDVDESWGLFEDANGFGYILRKGDRVKNGRLNKLTQTRAYFQLNEFGWSRSVELELEPEG